jgi:hypothetical protein
MPSDMLAHPLLGMATVSLILGAFSMKAGERKFWSLHHATIDVTLGCW